MGEYLLASKHLQRARLTGPPQSYYAIAVMELQRCRRLLSILQARTSREYVWQGAFDS
jgi:hypothetical protein